MELQDRFHVIMSASPLPTHDNCHTPTVPVEQPALAPCRYA
jgi:hypothetical protein